MRIRDVYLLNQQTLNDSDTVTVNLTGVGKILYLRIQYRAKNGTTTNTLCKLNGSVSKLAVLDGSNVIQSLSMKEAMARNAFMYHRMPYQFLSEDDDDVIIEEAFLDFRRMTGDTQFYLDTSAFQNPQLQMTHALPISATAGFVTGSGRLTVIARVIDSGAPSRLGFVMAKELDSFASAASGDHSTDLPLDFPISHILVGDPQDGQGADYALSNFKLTADADSFIPVNMSYLDLIQWNEREYGLFEQNMLHLETNASVLLFDLYNDVRGALGTADPTTPGAIASIAGNTITLTAGTGTGTHDAVAARGGAPFSSVIYPFGDGISPDQIWTPAGTSKFQLKLTNANTGSTPKVVVVQQHP